MEPDNTNRAVMTFRYPGGTVTVEGEKEFVRDQANRFSRLMAELQVQPDISGTAQVRSNSFCPERQLVQEKSPQGHGQTIAVLAFCLADAGTTEFTAEDMRRAYIRANVRPPKVMAQGLRDCKNKFDFLEPGTVKGTFRLSAHGDRLVRFDLPQKAKG